MGVVDRSLYFSYDVCLGNKLGDKVRSSHSVVDFANLHMFSAGVLLRQ